MKKKGASSSGNSFRILLFFLGIVFMVVLLALSVKIASIFTKSTFDGSHRYTLLITTKPIQIISFAPDSKTISILQVSTKKNPEKAFVVNKLHMPIDATISEKEKILSLEDVDIKNEIATYMQHVFFSYPGSRTSMTVLDEIRLWLFANSVELHNVFTATLPSNLEDTEGAVVDKTASSFFSDDSISKENQSIQVVNATGQAGVGNSFAQILTNIGANVISVNTATDEKEKTSITYTMPKSYTVEKLEQILGVKATSIQKQTMFAIIVTIGKDKLSQLSK